jgi:hypothetical protein
MQQAGSAVPLAIPAQAFYSKEFCSADFAGMNAKLFACIFLEKRRSFISQASQFTMKYRRGI